MEFHSKRDYLNFSLFTFVALIAIFNPTTVHLLKVLCVLALITIFFFAMKTHTATIKRITLNML